MHPDVKDRAVQATFEIAGFRMSPTRANITMARGRSVDIPLTLYNRGGSAITGLEFDMDVDDGFSATNLRPDIVSVPAGSNKQISLRLGADGDAPDTGIVLINATVAQGLSQMLTANITTVEPIPLIDVSPSYIDTGMVIGDSKLATFEISNKGYGMLENARLEGPGIEWIRMTTDPAIGNIPAGESREIGLIITPTTDVPVGVYDDTIRILSDNHITYTYHVQITVSSEAVGSVVFDVLNEFYEDVEGAEIIFQHQTLYELIYKASTGADGTVTMHDIPEGNYRFMISAPGHVSWRDSFTVEPGTTTTVPIGLQLDLIGIEWSVTPVAIEDRYEITVQQTFATKVPAPVLVIEPGSINIPYLEPGEVFNGEFKVTNYGLIEVFDIYIDFSTQVGDFDIEVFSDTMPDKLGAMQSVTVPFRITRKTLVEITQTAWLYGEVMGYGGGGCDLATEVSVHGKCIVCAEAAAAREAKVIAGLTLVFIGGGNRILNICAAGIIGTAVGGPLGTALVIFMTGSAQLADMTIMYVGSGLIYEGITTPVCPANTESPGPSNPPNPPLPGL